MSTATVQVYRLELHDSGANHFKQWTAFLSDTGHAVFAWGRIGHAYQWKQQPMASASAASIVQKKSQEKRLKGYDDVWSGDIVVPADWFTSPSVAGQRALEQAVERARLEGRSRFETGVGDERDTALARIITQARDTVSKVAADPDSGVREYAALVAVAEEIKGDLAIVDNYIDTLRLMLAGAGKGAA